MHGTLTQDNKHTCAISTEKISMKYLYYYSLVLLCIRLSLPYKVKPYLGSGEISRSSTFKFSITHIPRNDMLILSPNRISQEQWSSYWGINPMERLQKVRKEIGIIRSNGTQNFDTKYDKYTR